MVSAFTMLWGAVFLFLQSLASGVELSEVRDDAAPVPTGRQHPLLQIAADCVVVMVEHNRALLREAREMSRVGVAAEVLCVALNNYAWLQHYSTKILMTDRAAVAELLSQCTADALQDVVTGFVGDVQYVLAMYLAPRSTERPRITRRVLTTRLLAVRSFCSSLARSLPRQEILSLVLERALRPVAEQLLEEKDQHVVDWSSGSNSGGVAGALHSASLSPGAPFIGAVEDEDADGGEDSMTMAQRLTEALRILESDAAFGSVLCLQSSSFCTIRRLQSIMAP
ncbi:putative ankyrin repeat protein [Trypanosoma grayi]|uniref:putative ankyrin repeat protein n=1 Tax=Trypanosoma grayi TaxID=71804 RepID=UPI0004F49F88|nr:putative ankyrin repeat protein [Trypanosoma grayi]KEG10010.1 putative ankyrin repeat protein [Trypanosoma grayi]